MDPVILGETSEKLREHLIGAIVFLRNAIREHRDQKGDDRCWLDDELFKKRLGLPALTEISSKEEMEWRCKEFHASRQCPEVLGKPNKTTPPPDDSDLNTLTALDLNIKFQVLLNFCLAYAKKDERNWAHDLFLYSLLPEKYGGDTRLPPENEFLQSCALFSQVKRDERPQRLHEW